MTLKTGIRKSLKWLLLCTASLLLILGLAGFIIAHFYQDKIRELFVSELNKNLQTEISVKDISFSFFHQFPYATLKFTDILAKEVVISKNKDTLLFAKSLLLNFNILDIYYKKYSIKRIDIRDGICKTKVFKDLSDNFHFWKPPAEGQNGNFSFALNLVAIKNMKITYQNFASSQDYRLFATDVRLKGKFNTENYNLRVRGGLFIKQLESGKIKYVRNKDAKIDLDLAADQQNGIYHFRRGSLNLGKLAYDITGNVVYTESNKTLNLSISAREGELRDLVADLPAEFSDKLKEYDAEGRYTSRIEINGRYGGSDLPHIRAAFRLYGARVARRKSDIAITNLAMEGTYDNGSSENLQNHSLELKNISGSLKNSDFKGLLLIRGFRNAEFELELLANLNLEEVSRFLPSDQFVEPTGKVGLKFYFKGRPSDPAHFTADDFLKSRANGNLAFTNVNFRLKDKQEEFRDVNGSMLFSNNDLVVNDLKWNIDKSDFSIKGYFRNLLPWIFIHGQNLMVNAQLSSGNIELAQIMAIGTTRKTGVYKLEFPAGIDLDLGISLKKLSFQKFSATDINGSIKYRNFKLFVNGLNLRTASGEFSMNGQIDGTGEKIFQVSCEADIKHADIKSMFTEFGNFGQSYVKDENLKGFADIRLQSSFRMDPALQINPASIIASFNISIDNGELLNFKPIYGLSKFIRVDDLSDVKFSSLRNEIIIRDQKIIIPEMEVKSDALNFTMSGTQAFNNEINYKFRILLSEFLSRKAKKAKKENTEFGIEEESTRGRTTLFILLTGTTDKPVFRYDSKSVKGKIVSEYLNERQKIKKLFKDEFGRSKKEQDSIKVKEKEFFEKQESGKFILEWEGNRLDTMGVKKESKKEPEKEAEKKKKEEKPRFKIDWD